jgi:hypothetical protein
MKMLGLLAVTGAQLAVAGLLVPQAGHPAARSPQGRPGDGLRKAAVWKRARVPPCRGVRIPVGRRIQPAIDSHRPGTTFCIVAGNHRISRPLIAKSGDRFIGARGAVVSGAKLLVGFERSGRWWSIGGQTEQNPATVGRCSSNSSDGCQLANDVYEDDRVLRRVVSLSALGPGRFYFDYEQQRIYLGSSPRGHKLEVGVATRAWQGVGVGAYDVTIQGLTIEKFANEAQIGAIEAGRGWVVEDSEVRLNHGGGISDATITRRNYVHDNGQIGVGGNAPDLVVADNEISFNDYAGFCTCWEAGGGKWSRARHLVVRDNNVHDNIGPGLWTDTDNIDVLYAHNVVRRNTGVGIFHETSFDAVIRDNVVTGNGRAWTGWLDGAGILINSSPNIQIYGNTVLNNKDGIGITQWDRGSSPTLGPHQVHDISVHDNTVALHTGFSGMLQGVGDVTYYTSRNIRFDRNTYRLGCNEHYFVWQGTAAVGYSAVTSSEWRASGMDRNGHFSSICRH